MCPNEYPTGFKTTFFSPCAAQPIFFFLSRAIFCGFAYFFRVQHPIFCRYNVEFFFGLVKSIFVGVIFWQLFGYIFCRTISASSSLISVECYTFKPLNLHMLSSFCCSLIFCIAFVFSCILQVLEENPSNSKIITKLANSLLERFNSKSILNLRKEKSEKNCYF
jgi:hypothetical protein